MRLRTFVLLCALCVLLSATIALTEFTDEEVSPLTPETTPRGIYVDQPEEGAFDLLPLTLRNHFENLIAIAKEKCNGWLVHDSVPCLEGHIYGQQALYYHLASKAPYNRVFCEIGFNAGHSTLAYLVANPDAQVVSFDLFHKPYSAAALQYVGNHFPDRQFYIGGNSTVMVPQVASEYPWLKCDVISVDGGHEHQVPRDDLINMGRFAHCDTLLLLDDATTHIIRRHWKALQNEGIIREMECHSHIIAQPYASVGPIPRGFCAGRYVQAPCITKAERDQIYANLASLHQANKQ